MDPVLPWLEPGAAKPDLAVPRITSPASGARVIVFWRRCRSESVRPSPSQPARKGGISMKTGDGSWGRSHDRRTFTWSSL